MQQSAGHSRNGAIFMLALYFHSSTCRCPCLLISPFSSLASCFLKQIFFCCSLNSTFSTDRAPLFVCFQINILLNFSAGEDCPCPEDIQDELNSFHDELRLHCGKVQHTAFQIYVLCSLTLWHRNGRSLLLVWHHSLNWCKSFLTEMCLLVQEFPWRRKRKSRTLR